MNTLEEFVPKAYQAAVVEHSLWPVSDPSLGNLKLEPGEPVQLVEVGSHSGGVICLDGKRYGTVALSDAMERLARTCDGFYFGRFDLRAPSLERFEQGRDFRVLELNGVTSEATHIYDPQYTLFQAWRTLFEQWRLAFEVGARNRARGVEPASVAELLRLLFGR